MICCKQDGDYIILNGATIACLVAAAKHILFTVFLFLLSSLSLAWAVKDRVQKNARAAGKIETSGREKMPKREGQLVISCGLERTSTFFFLLWPVFF